MHGETVKFAYFEFICRQFLLDELVILTTFAIRLSLSLFNDAISLPKYVVKWDERAVMSNQEISLAWLEVLCMQTCSRVYLHCQCDSFDTGSSITLYFSRCNNNFCDVTRCRFVNTECCRNNSHILKVNKNQTKQDTRKILLFIKSTYDANFSNTFKGNIAPVPAVIDDKLLKSFTEVVHGFAGHRWRNGSDFLSYCLP